MRFKVLSSGSKGNSTFVSSKSTKVLIDLGVGYQYLIKELEKINVDPLELAGVLVTHIHNDHVKGLKVFLKKTGLKAFIPEKMKKEVLTIIDEEMIEIIDDCFKLNDLNIELIYTSHDVECSVGYKITSDDKSLLYITDTGYINNKYFEMFKNLDAYILESNHDEKMLMDGPYPYYLKQRVISDYGHLSNKACAKYLKNFVGEKTKNVVLAHLSDTNNAYDIAFNETYLKLNSVNYNGKIIIALQNESIDMVEV